MSTHREIEFRRQIEALNQPDLITILCATVATIDDEHLGQALEMMNDDDLGTLVAKGIVEQRERRENREEEEESRREYAVQDDLHTTD